MGTVFFVNEEGFNDIVEKMIRENREQREEIRKFLDWRPSTDSAKE
jgi:hypothetical protein